MFADYAQYDALGLAELVRSRALSPAELLETALAGIDRLNPAVNAVNRRMDASARAQVAAGLPEGPLHGVPYLVKDLVASCAGEPLGAGTALLQTVKAERDSELVCRLRRAGMVIAGRTATPEFGLTPYTEPVVGGPVRNPWRRDLTSGGSSGGAAAAVACGMVPAASGGDGGGSIRIPASFCGLFGMKPSRGRTPAGPDAGVPWHGLAQEHALTRSVRDSAVLLDITQGMDAGAPYTAPDPGEGFLAAVGQPPGRLRIAYTSRPLLGGGQPHPDCLRALEDAVALLESLGHHLEEAAPDIDPVATLLAYFIVVAGETRADIEWAARMAGVRPAMRDFEPSTWVLGLIGKSYSALDFVNACRQFDKATRQSGEFFRNYDVLLTPTMAIPPHAIGALQPSRLEGHLMKVFGALGSGKVLRWVNIVEQMLPKVFDGMPYTPLFNITGQPAMSVPLYWNDGGLPIGVQCAGRFGEEALLFKLAAQLEEARPWAGRRPPSWLN
ncbi:amidase [Paludibacterium paludis]|uniref:6-aminohexanoate-cyclic-dimer hydrolase n=1 Tax=Paludibacterium paludis TaxID=1225769 RepID=A0A918NYU3_9NEIS|nr:amidase [Paludibacterium paludis]GGY07177.1 6-aminohexanoate-cyclic-dimer hydrolase [Paludibacterium paludis]